MEKEHGEMCGNWALGEAVVQHGTGFQNLRAVGFEFRVFALGSGAYSLACGVYSGIQPQERTIRMAQFLSLGFGVWVL